MEKNLKVIEISSDNCGQCQVVGKYLKELLDDKWEYEMINYNDAKNYVRKYQVLTVPTTIFLINGEERDRFVGMKTRKEVQNIIMNCENIFEYQKISVEK